MSAISLVVWAVDVIAAERARPLNFWLVLGLGFAVLTLLLWGLEQRAQAQKPGASNGVNIGTVESLTVSLGASSGAAPATSAAQPSVTAPPLGDRRYVVPNSVFRKQRIRLADLVETDYPILDRVTFEDCELVGPAMILPQGQFTLYRCELHLADANAFWAFEFGDGRNMVVGVIGLRDCTLSRCTLFNLGFAGAPEALGALREAVGL